MQVSATELSLCDGKRSERILLSILGLVYDCTHGGAESFGDGRQVQFCACSLSNNVFLYQAVRIKCSLGGMCLMRWPQCH